MTDRPLVTVIIPTRAERAHIGRCLEAVANQTYPLSHIEVLVVDGASVDGTAEAAKAALAAHPFAHTDVLHNDRATTPTNLNLGLFHARGDIVCRVDARSVVPPSYVQRCVELLTGDPDLAVVGGAQLAIPSEDTALGRGIARALNNPWAMGLSRYRRHAHSGITDTAYLGAFRTAQLRELGGWDERLDTNQDFDLSRRMSRLGHVWFEEGIDVGYVPRQSISALFRQYRRFGRWKVNYWRMTGDRPRPRQVVLLILPSLSLVLLGVMSTRRPRSALAVGAAPLAVLALSGGPAPVADRVVSVVANLAVGTGWLAGTYGEMLRAREDALQHDEETAV